MGWGGSKAGDREVVNAAHLPGKLTSLVRVVQKIRVPSHSLALCHSHTVGLSFPSMLQHTLKSLERDQILKYDYMGGMGEILLLIINNFS